MEFSGDYNPKEFCWRDLELLTDFFSEENFIGKINFGKVYREKLSKVNKLLSKFGFISSMKGIAIFVSEGIFLSDPDVVHHPNLVKLMGCYCEVEYGHFGVFYDLRSKDTLLNLIDKDDLTWTQRVKVALDIARLVEHLHHHKPPYVLHFTHPALIMLDQDYNPVLFDFFNLSGGAVGDKQLSSYSDMFTFSQGYHGYIDVNFLMTEVLLTELQHPNVVKLIGHCEGPCNFYLVYELIEGGTVNDKLLALSWEETVKILRGVANGLVYLHIFQEHAIVCGDMKPQNILLGNDYVAKISDFGLAKVEMEQVISNTRAYFPYCNAGGLVNCANDIYAFGVIILELIRKSAAVWIRFPSSSRVILRHSNVKSISLLASILLQPPNLKMFYGMT